MGACEFFTSATGDTAKNAFMAAAEAARYESGHGGYTGTIAEKYQFVMIDLPKGKDPWQFADELMEASDPRIENKWGPAGCIKVRTGMYLFFGWASS